MDFVIDHSKRIVDSFEQVMAALNLLSHHIQSELVELPVWAETPERTFTDNRNKIIYAIRKHEIDMAIAPQETFTFAGAVAGNEKTMALVQEVNTAKSTFKSVVLAYHNSEAYHYSVPARKFLSRAGYVGVKLKQVYRHLAMLDYHPRKITWSKAKDSSNTIITIEEAEEKLLKAGQGDHIEIQLKKLKSLDPNEKLVVRRTIKAHSIANVSMIRPGDGELVTTKLKASLPIFFLHNPKLPKTAVCFSKHRPRKIEGRRDRKLQLEPFLSSISAYQYHP